MTTDQYLIIISPLITLIFGALLNYYTKEKSKLISFLGHVSVFKLKDEENPEKPTVLFTHSIVVSNSGRKSAQNVRLVHDFLPIDINIYPPIKYSLERNSDNSGDIVIPIMVPKEQITISYLYFPPMTYDKINRFAKSDDGFAKVIKVIPMPQPPKVLIYIVWFLVFIGLSFLLYWLMKLITYLI